MRIPVSAAWIKSLAPALLAAAFLTASVAADDIVIPNRGISNSGISNSGTELFVRGANSEYRELSSEDVGRSRTFTRDDIETFTPLSADTFLSRVPGFSLFRRSSSLATNPTAQGVSLRGTGPSGASRTLVLVDGIPVNDPFGGWVNWQSIPLEGVDRITVRQNWGSTHWSYLGLGSAIEIRTKEPGVDEQSAKLALGTEDTGVAHVLARGGDDRVGYSVGGEYARTGGYKTVDADDRGPIDIDADSEHGLAYGKVISEPAARQAYYLLANGFEENRGNGTPLTSNESSSYKLATGGRIESSNGGTARFDLFGIRGNFESTFSSQAPDRASETPASDQFDVPSEQVGASVDWSIRYGGRHYIEVGADVLKRRGETREDFRFLEGSFERRRIAGAEQTALGLYGYDRYRFDNRWALDLFLRVDTWRNDESYRRESDLGSGLIDRDDRSDGSFDTFFGPRMQLSYEPNSDSTFRTALTRGFRIPTANELARPFRVRNDITEANQNLEAEEIVGYDIEYRYRKDRVEANINPYVNRIHGAVANVTVAADDAGAVCGFVPEGGVCRRRDNLDEVWIAGVETTLAYRLAEGLKVNASYLYSHSSIDERGNAGSDGKRSPQLAAHQALVGVERTAETHRAYVQARFVGSQFEDDLNTLSLDPFVTVDASVTVPVTARAELFATAQNLLGTRYIVGKTAEGVESVGPPLLAFAGIRMKF